jgi:predicted dinucleotide-binding enzyme
MNIGIIGAGYIGSTAAHLFIEAGHGIAIANSRGPETLQILVEELGPKARAATVEDAARFGEIVLLAIPFKDYPTLPADALRGKVVIDALNYYPNRDGNFPQLDDDQITSSELVAQHLTGARLVKAFNTIWFEHLRRQSHKELPVGQRRAIFMSGDYEEAKNVVAKLIEEIGFGAVDLGTLRNSRRQQPGAPVYNRDVTVEQAQNL